MDECPICLSEIDNSVYETKCCKKKFHVNCYNECIKIKNACPLCRAAQEETPLLIQEIEYTEDLSCYRKAIFVFLTLFYLFAFLKYIS